MAFIEHQILMLAANSGALETAVRTVEARYALPNGALGNGVSRQTRLLSLLYHLVALPREIALEKALSDPKVSNAWNEWSSGSSKTLDDGIEVCRQLGLAQTTRLLRNSVVHGRVQFRDHNLRFEDRKQSLSIGITAIDTLLSSFGAELANSLANTGTGYEDHQ
ncbi:hypothetical protein [Jannaschia faecimaris]|uniref:hypothetical protein n=1 Tax=Jannaschia faecimaris TaxID=1244108 RepID=UPI001113F09D|nr:hypothetical protein [Jannaschia faecimaris]